MGLWTGVPERLQSPICSLYEVSLQMIEQAANGTISVIQKPIDTLTEFASKSGLTGKSTDQNTEEPKEKNATEPKKDDKLLPKVPIPKIPMPKIPFGR